MTDLVPEEFRRQVPQDRADWLRHLPRLVETLVGEWELRPDGAVRWGRCALVVPVVTATGPAALKVGWPHDEARHEHLALRHWAGRGAVRLIRADPARFALLLERLDPDRDLHGMPPEPACAVVGSLLRELRVPAPPQLPSTRAYAGRQVNDLATAPRGIPRRFVDQARSIAADLAHEDATDEPASLLHTDLHYANVLAGARATWSAIDPKPLGGDPAFEVAPVLHNRGAELGAGGSVRRSILRRFDIVCEHAQIDTERARAWTIVREVDDALDALARGAAGQERLGLAVAVVKAMNP